MTAVVNCSERFCRCHWLLAALLCVWSSLWFSLRYVLLLQCSGFRAPSFQVQRAKRPTAHMTAYDLCWSAMGMLNYWVGDGKYLGAFEVRVGDVNNEQMKTTLRSASRRFHKSYVAPAERQTSFSRVVRLDPHNRCQTKTSKGRVPGKGARQHIQVRSIYTSSLFFSQDLETGGLCLARRPRRRELTRRAARGTTWSAAKKREGGIGRRRCSRDCSASTGWSSTRSGFGSSGSSRRRYVLRMYVCMCRRRGSPGFALAASRQPKSPRGRSRAQVFDVVLGYSMCGCFVAGVPSNDSQCGGARALVVVCRFCFLLA